MEVAETIYKLLNELPDDEKFNLKHQIKKCAVSIPSNIAEGSGRNSKNEFLHFLSIANGSSFELITQLILSKRLNLINEEKVERVISELIEICNMNYALQRSLRSA